MCQAIGKVGLMRFTLHAFFVYNIAFADIIFTCITFENTLGFVKIIPKENSNFDLALRKRLFCDAKPMLLPCKTAAFGMQNNRFCNTLVYSELRNKCSLEK